jgi:hypothetical protein
MGRLRSLSVLVMFLFPEACIGKGSRQPPTHVGVPKANCTDGLTDNPALISTLCQVCRPCGKLKDHCDVPEPCVVSGDADRCTIAAGIGVLLHAGRDGKLSGEKKVGCPQELEH